MRINKEIEYALIALAFMKDGSLYSASQIAEQTRIPYKLLCKLLQRLKDSRLVLSIPGSKGGYRISRDLSKMTLQEVMTAVREETDIISCNSPGGCTMPNHCSISSGMKALQKTWDKMLSGITIEKFISLNRFNPDEGLFQFQE